MHFSFATAQQIFFGSGCLERLGPLAAPLGTRALVVTGQSPDRARPVLDRLHTQSIRCHCHAVSGEPTIDTVQEALAHARRHRVDLVVGVGGGSTLDTAKAVAILFTNPGEPLRYLEVIGQGQPLTNAPLPCLAIPTTAGTGSEVTANSVLDAPAFRVKVSLRSPLMLPRLALIDPCLTLTLPGPLTAATGLDALTQVLEPLVTPFANPLCDGFCRDGLRLASRSLRRAYADGSDLKAREDMALVSLYGGLALANAKLGAVHGLAGPLGGLCHAPHGLLCAALLPWVMQANIQVLANQDPHGPALVRYREVAVLLTGDPSATAEEGCAWVYALCRALAIPSLAELGLDETMCDELIPRALKASSMQGNPVHLTEDDLHSLLSAALTAERHTKFR